MEDSVNPRNQGIKESRNQRYECAYGIPREFGGYECHLDIHPNQRRIRGINGMNALWHSPGIRRVTNRTYRGMDVYIYFQNLP